MNLRRMVAFVVCGTLAVVLLPADELDLETAVAMAIENNLGIQGEVAAVRQKKLIADTWWNRFIPTASARATLGRWNLEQTASGLVPASETSSGSGVYDTVVPYSADVPRWFTSVGLDFELNLTMQLVPGISLAQLDYRGGLISLEDAKRRLTRDVSKAFYDLLLLREQIELVEEQIDTAERRYRQALLNYENGLVDEFTMLSARVAWENQKPGLTGLETGYQRALMGFKLQVGVPFTTELTPVGTIDPPKLDEGLATVDRQRLEGRLDIQGQYVFQEILQEQVSLARATRLPVISLGFSVDPTFGGDPWEDDLFDFDLWDQQSGMFRITVVQPLDGWLPFSTARNEIAAAQTEVERQRLRIQQQIDGAEMEARSLLLSIRSAEETVEALELNIDLAERAYELAEIGYNNGLRDLLEVQNAEVELKSAQFQVLQQKKDIVASLIDLEYALDVDLTGE